MPRVTTRPPATLAHSPPQKAPMTPRPSQVQVKQKHTVQPQQRMLDTLLGPHSERWQAHMRRAG